MNRTEAKIVEKFAVIPADETINKTVESLKANGIDAMVVENSAEAKKKLFEIIPEGAEIMNNTSITLDTIGATEEILHSGKYKPVRDKLYDPNVSPKEKAILGTTADWATGSAHAVTEEGTIMIASNTGSQIPSEAYGSPNVVLVVGAQKIVKNRDEGFKRIYDHVLPLESERANKAYNITTGSFVSKLLIINREIKPNRIRLILVKEALGF
ncbi:MAG TPA: lactate utilization protein [Patescibacteria group bacterium]